MQQLAGNENRPRQLGDTGIIVLTKCDQGVCDCNQAQKPKDKTKAKTKVTPQKPRNFASAGQTRQRNTRLPTSNRNRSLGHSGKIIIQKTCFLIECDNFLRFLSLICLAILKDS